MKERSADGVAKQPPLDCFSKQSTSYHDVDEGEGVAKLRVSGRTSSNTLGEKGPAFGSGAIQIILIGSRSYAALCTRLAT